MDNEKLAKLINCELNTPDNILGKSLLLHTYPEIKLDIVMGEYSSNKIVYRKDVEKFGLSLEKGKHVLQFDIDYFPELYK